MTTKRYQVLAAWLETGKEEVRQYFATSLSEALTMAERADAGIVDGPTVYGILPADYDVARTEGIQFNEADGLLTEVK